CWRSILKNFDTMNLPENFGSWAMTIASRKAIDWLRSQQAQRKHINPDDLPLEKSEEPENETDSNQYELLEQMKLEMRQLSDEQRAILSLFYLDRLPIKQISSILRIPAGTVKSRLFHAREQLKKRLTERISHEE
ncbi:MAG: sigma-70 family RNA polymerase sigma factor, partial [Calditrichaeota bacterium]|nr:sigma-70 family RNA polymerase sigma factor [Calditrichota bacterium]